MNMTPASGKIDLSSWNFGCGDLDEFIAKVATEALRHDFKENPPWMSLPMHSTPKGDPLRLDVWLPMSDDDCVIYHCSIADAAKAFLSDYVTGDEDLEQFRSFVTALRGLADELEISMHQKKNNKLRRGNKLRRRDPIPELAPIDKPQRKRPKI